MKQHTYSHLIALFPLALAMNVLGETHTAQAYVGNQAFLQSHGAIGVNMAAGDANAQMNARVLSINAGQRRSNAVLSTRQLLDGAPLPEPETTVSHIGSGAFAGASGLISVNQASGAANLQFNGALIGLGIDGSVTTDSLLAATNSGTQANSPLLQDGSRVRVTHIGDGAFKNTKGLVQINQLAGVKNITSNNFTLSILLGTRAE